MKLVIAEKPSVAQSIARIIGAAGRKVPDRTLFRLYHHHGLFRLYAELRQHPGTHGQPEKNRGTRGDSLLILTPSGVLSRKPPPQRIA